MKRCVCILVLSIVLLLSGCKDNVEVKEIDNDNTNRFQTIEEGYYMKGFDVAIIVDTKYNNEYILAYSTSGYSAMSPLLDENGNVVKYNK